MVPGGVHIRALRRRPCSLHRTPAQQKEAANEAYATASIQRYEGKHCLDGQHQPELASLREADPCFGSNISTTAHGQSRALQCRYLDCECLVIFWCIVRLQQNGCRQQCGTLSNPFVSRLRHRPGRDLRVRWQRHRLPHAAGSDERQLTAQSSGRQATVRRRGSRFERSHLRASGGIHREHFDVNDEPPGVLKIRLVLDGTLEVKWILTKLVGLVLTQAAELPAHLGDTYATKSGQIAVEAL